MIGRIGSVDRDAAAFGMRGGDHRERQLARSHRAHLGEEVEVVLENPDDVRLRFAQHRDELVHAAGEGCVEERDVVPALTQRAGDEQRRQRRVGPHALALLAVFAQEKRAREKNHRGTLKVSVRQYHCPLLRRAGQRPQ